MPISEDGTMTRREHFKQLSDQMHVEELDGPEMPEKVAYLYEWFLELNKARTYGMNGPNPISYQELQAWADMTKRKLSSFEAEAIKAIDNTLINTANNG